MRNKKVYSISVNSETMQVIKSMAKNSKTSTSNYIEKLLVKHIAETNVEVPVQSVTN